ncbi:MAG: DUF1292 domain-containing protein [Ruminococcaceae bacterium]|nr:DUF1292 domain-containing protein [Oscillospiraceae bacterium]
MDNEFDIITITDDDGNDYSFEELDRIETEDGKRYVAVIPLTDDNEDEASDDESVELIFLRVASENNEVFLEPIDDDNEFNEVAEIFTERLSEFYDIQ